MYLNAAVIPVETFQESGEEGGGREVEGTIQV
jgi:hypothetical protein